MAAAVQNRFGTSRNVVIDVVDDIILARILFNSQTNEGRERENCLRRDNEGHPLKQKTPKEIFQLARRQVLAGAAATTAVWLEQQRFVIRTAERSKKTSRIIIES